MDQDRFRLITPYLAAEDVNSLRIVSIAIRFSLFWAWQATLPVSIRGADIDAFIANLDQIADAVILPQPEPEPEPELN